VDQNVAALATKMIKEYYSRLDNLPLKDMGKREFGFGEYDKKISYRHLSFPNFTALKRYLVETAPPFISYSAAEYERPEARPIERKGLLGAELVFDLDANDLQLPCIKIHGSKLVCSICLDAVKKETIRLVEEFLVPDFGLSKDEISINFSGNRGYHVHISDPKVFTLDNAARREISNYISPPDFDPSRFFPTLGMKGVALHGPKPTDKGWGGKLARSVITAMNSGEEALIALGIPKELARKLIKSKGGVVMGISSGNWDQVQIPKKGEFWGNVMNGITIKQSNSIDRNVTNDPRHLIRLPETIHGETGLIAKSVRMDEIGKFDPMKDAIIFKGSEILVKTGKVPAFTMAGKQFGPYENKTLGLPIYAAIYLMLKGLATPGV
jgi:DNA primase small subunit